MAQQAADEAFTSLGINPSLTDLARLSENDIERIERHGFEFFAQMDAESKKAVSGVISRGI